MHHNIRIYSFVIKHRLLVNPPFIDGKSTIYRWVNPPFIDDLFPVCSYDVPVKTSMDRSGISQPHQWGLCDAFCSSETPCHISWGVGPRGRYVKRPWQIQPSKVKGKNGELITKNERFRIFRIDGYWWIWILIYGGFWYNHANVGIYGGYLYLGNVNQPLERLLQYPLVNSIESWGCSSTSFMGILPGMPTSTASLSFQVIL